MSYLLCPTPHRYYIYGGQCVNICPANYYVGKDGYTCTACPLTSTNPYPNKNTYCLCPGEPLHRPCLAVTVWQCLAAPLLGVPCHTPNKPRP